MGVRLQDTHDGRSRPNWRSQGRARRVGNRSVDGERAARDSLKLGESFRPRAELRLEGGRSSRSPAFTRQLSGGFSRAPASIGTPSAYRLGVSRRPGIPHRCRYRCRGRDRDRSRDRGRGRDRSRDRHRGHSSHEADSSVSGSAGPRSLCLAALALWALAGVASARAAAPTASPFLRVEGPYIVDPQGRIVILRGLNTGNVGKDGSTSTDPSRRS